MGMSAAVKGFSPNALLVTVVMKVPLDWTTNVVRACWKIKFVSKSIKIRRYFHSTNQSSCHVTLRPNEVPLGAFCVCFVQRKNV